VADSIVLTALTSIYEERGYLNAAVVVEKASDPGHVLHARFEWSDAAAASAYRLLQASSLIRSVKLKVSNPEPVEVRAFVHVPGPGPTAAGTYVPEAVVRDDPVLRAIALGEMSRQWRFLRRKYEAHREFWDLVADDLAAAVGG